MFMQDIESIVAGQRAFFQTGATRESAFRLARLRELAGALRADEPAILAALKADLGKSAFEGFATEIGVALDEIGFLLKHLPGWLKPRRVRTPLLHFPAESSITPEPYGLSLILSPWNYPLLLTLSPLIGSMAAGNCAVLKPSAYAAETSALLARLLGRTFAPEYLAVVEGGREENTALLEQRFDYLFFTGSVEVGKTVMAAAARHLTPVTLELGGKSPCIVEREAHLDLAARRIVWGKFLNAGQTCIAPDYLLVQESAKEELIGRLRFWIQRFYGEEPARSPDYARIVNRKHVQRLARLMGSGKVVCGGVIEEDERYVAPTILTDVSWEDPVMKEEIFGPLLPILSFGELAEAIAAVNRRPKPLALYFFSDNRARQRRVLREVSFGGGCINETLSHIVTPHLPFGGVGESGLGRYHGRASFDTFSHYKSVLRKSTLLDLGLRYPPYRDKLRWVKKVWK